MIIVNGPFFELTVQNRRGRTNSKLVLLLSTVVQHETRIRLE